MNFISTRIITNDVDQLVKFYEKITGIKALQYTVDFVEFQYKNANLAIGSVRTLQFFGGEEVAKASQNRTAIIEFIVEDVEAVYNNLAITLQNFLVQKPTLMPWGNKSLLFRDPDGNLVNFFTPVTPDAI